MSKNARRETGRRRTNAASKADRRRTKQPVGAAGNKDALVKSLFVFVLLAAALCVSVFYYRGHREPKVFPVNSPAIDGIVSEVYRMYAGGAAGEANAAGPGADGNAEQPAGENPDAQDASGETEGGGTDKGASEPLAVAGSYGELLTQIGSAIDAQDKAFLQQKLKYQDSSGNYQAYSDGQIEGFAVYMKANPAEKEQFFLDIADAGVYGGDEQGSYVVKLPQIYFAITADTDNTTVVVDTFEAAVVNTADTLSKGPLLPMVYKIYASNEAWLTGTQTEVPIKLTDTSVSIAIKGNKGGGEESGEAQ